MDEMAFNQAGEQIAREAFRIVGLDASLTSYGIICVMLHDRMIGIEQDGDAFTVADTNATTLATSTVRVTGALANPGTLAMLIDHIATNELEVTE